MLYVESKLDFISSTYIKCQSIDRVVNNTQPDQTLFFLIFTYLWGISHRRLKNYGAIAWNLFRLYFEVFEKSCRGRHHSEISKHYGHAFRSVRGVKIIGRTKGSISWCLLALIFIPNRTNLKKNVKTVIW